MVKKFFEKIAPWYDKRYQSESVYYHYFFNQRLEAATNNFNFENASILDIGAGTGPLYNFLVKDVDNFTYLACDISPAMLANSSIPYNQQIVGQVTEIDFSGKNFDYIFMLGVSTYIEKKDFEAHIKIIENLLKEKGKAIVSFTHSYSIDNRFRRAFSLFAPLIARFHIGSKKVFVQPFQTSSYRLDDINKFPLEKLTIVDHQWLNQTISPFNHLFSRFSVFVAYLLKKYLPPAILPFYSADLLVVFEKKESILPK